MGQESFGIEDSGMFTKHSHLPHVCSVEKQSPHPPDAYGGGTGGRGPGAEGGGDTGGGGGGGKVCHTGQQGTRRVLREAEVTLPGPPLLRRVASSSASPGHGARAGGPSGEAEKGTGGRDAGLTPAHVSLSFLFPRPQWAWWAWQCLDAALDHSPSYFLPCLCPDSSLRSTPSSLRTPKPAEASDHPSTSTSQPPASLLQSSSSWG